MIKYSQSSRIHCLKRFLHTASMPSSTLITLEVMNNCSRGTSVRLEPLLQRLTCRFLILVELSLLGCGSAAEAARRPSELPLAIIE